jgi:tRNA (uracil-5-)-methyltransferase
MINVDHLSYGEQLAKKELFFKELFSSIIPFERVQLKKYESPEKHYRMRTEFRVWHNGEDLYFFMFDKETKEKIRIDQFPPASKIINLAMSSLIEHIKTNKTLRFKLFQVDFLSTTQNELLITLIYHRRLEDEWNVEAKKLKEALSSIGKIHIVGRAKKQKILIDQEYVEECLNVGGKDFIYKQIENSFTQPNATVAVKMLEWASSPLEKSSKDLLELYCGNGNFTIPLAHKFRQVLATEISTSSIEAALYNCLKNKTENIDFIRMSAEELSDALKGGREYFRLRNLDLSKFNFDTIFVDPPRSGIDSKTLTFMSQFDSIIYISCNPLTLKENLSELCKTHQVTDAAIFDQFPFTPHLECGVKLTKI